MIKGFCIQIQQRRDELIRKNGGFLVFVRNEESDLELL